MSYLSLSTNKTQAYRMIKEAATNLLRKHLKKVPEKHFDQELKSTAKTLKSFTRKKEENYTELS